MSAHAAAKDRELLGPMHDWQVAGPADDCPRDWSDARFTYWFIVDDHDQEEHVKSRNVLSEEAFSGLRVNKWDSFTPLA